MLDIEAASGTLAVLGFATMQLRDLHAVHTGRPVSGQRYHLAIQRSTVALHVAGHARMTDLDRQPPPLTPSYTHTHTHTPKHP